MSIINRLYNIAKAEVNSRIRPGSKSSKRWQKTSSEEGSNGEHQNTWQSKSEESSSQRSQATADDPVAEWYAALELPYGSDWDAVQKAWKAQLRKYHPDRHAQNQEKADIAHEVTQQLNVAYKGLKKHLGK